MTFAGQDGARLGGEVFHAKSKLIHADHTFCSGGQDTHWPPLLLHPMQFMVFGA